MGTRLGSLALVVAVGLFILLSFRITPLSAASGFGSDAFGPVGWALSGPWQQLQEIAGTLRTASELKAENERLQAEVDRLTQELVRLPEVERENTQLKEQLGLKQAQPRYAWRAAQVLGQEPSDIMRGLIISRGANDGIQRGMTVLSTNGSLVGRIVYVGATTSRVLLITDVSSSVSAVVQSSRAYGVVNGQRSGTLLMKYIRQGEQLKTGDIVVTSGVGGVFPEGFMVGRVTDVRQIDIEMFQEARVDSQVDFDRLETVLVITNYRPAKLD